MKKILSITLLVALSGYFAMAQSRTPSDTLNIRSYGIISAFDLNADTIKSATDSAELKTMWNIPGLSRGCVWELVIPKMKGTGNDSVKGIVGIKGYKNDGTFLYKYMTTDTCKDSLSYRYILPIEGLVAPADLYSIVIYGYTGSGGQVIFPSGRIYGLRPYTRQN
jgi:hypothetical protein